LRWPQLPKEALAPMNAAELRQSLVSTAHSVAHATTKCTRPIYTHHTLSARARARANAQAHTTSHMHG
jgi:hypothetical protein